MRFMRRGLPRILFAEWHSYTCDRRGGILLIECLTDFEEEEEGEEGEQPHLRGDGEEAAFSKRHADEDFRDLYKWSGLIVGS